MTPVEFRRHLHRHPELSFCERETARFITEALEAEGIECRPIAGTGVLARIGGAAKRAVVLRADIDALPIDEAAEVEWRSQNGGVMHACGHDIHAAVLFGVLQRLKQTGTGDMTVFGLFQPAEELNPGGAAAVLAGNPFEGYDIEAVVGEHIEAGMAVGTFGFCPGKFMASNDELRFTVRGRGGHAAMRDNLTDPVTAAAELIMHLSRLNGPDCVVSTGRVTADGATNVIPDEVRTEGTMRTFDEGLRADMKLQIKNIAAEVDRTHGTSTEVDISEGYPCVVNDPQLTAFARELASRHFKAVELPRRATSEDFGRYGLRYPSLFYRLGAGEESGAAHTSRFNPDERAIDFGVEFMELLVSEFSKRLQCQERIKKTYR